MSDNRTPALISHVEIENFKAVKHADVDLKQLTAVVGVNSSGKSTLIQAILLIVQHLRDEYSTELQYSLNEDLVQLGSFAETARRTGGRTSDEIKVAVVANTMSAPIARSLASDKVTWQVALQPDRSTESNFARVHSLRVDRESMVTDESGDLNPPTDLIIDSILELDSDEYKAIENVPVDGDRDQLRVVTGQLTTAAGTRVLRYAMFHQGHLPVAFQLMQISECVSLHVERRLNQVESLGSTLNSFKRLVMGAPAQAATQIAGGHRSEPALPQVPARQSTSRRQEPLARFTAQLEQSIREITEKFDHWPELFPSSNDAESGQSSQSRDESISLYLHDLRSIVVRTLNEYQEPLFSSGVTIASAAVAAAEATRKALGTSDLEVLAPSSTAFSDQRFARLRSDLRECFNQVHYLGPIRDIDRQHSGSFTRRSLGIHGEHCATVLQRESKEKVSKPPLPPGDSEVRETSRFGEILNAWMRHLDLVDEVQVEDRGRHKAGIKIVPRRGSRGTVPLQSVGVGVAQVLPVVMQCILAQPGTSITVIEQPELHLHPSIEVKLADFFIACARSGRQIFIETHSEHLINRLRLEIARDDSGDTRELVSVLFANQDEETGITEYENAVINEVGGIEGGWPDNFLDLSTDESLALLQVAVRRRQREQFAGSADDEEDF